MERRHLAGEDPARESGTHRPENQPWYRPALGPMPPRLRKDGSLLGLARFFLFTYTSRTFLPAPPTVTHGGSPTERAGENLC